MKHVLLALVLGASLAAGGAGASEPPGSGDAFAGLAPMDAADLARSSGRAGLSPEGGNIALLQNNQVGANTATGNNTITGSLNGTAGVTTVFQNTGNNSLFQATTAINITVR
ncbi:hypothetical protein [Caldovatus aquaticus]|uniref:Uncharacterized protein n=1 Tax=Caldovatus aquaticus TaxID=2865671 RepID=A0ABS7EYN4_9PROT|nr:hypothetical protein [Caldovatus aquaticus]MBW8268339.1 hypothetical protein [Caldovatus aquaticus]